MSGWMEITGLIKDLLARKGAKAVPAKEIAELYPELSSYMVSREGSRTWAVFVDTDDAAAETPLFGQKLPAQRRRVMMLIAPDQYTALYGALRELYPELMSRRSPDVLRMPGFRPVNFKHGHPAMAGNAHACPLCSGFGQGWYRVEMSNIYGHPQSESLLSLCPDCDGTGRAPGPRKDAPHKTIMGPNWRGGVAARLTEGKMTAEEFSALLDELSKNSFSRWLVAAQALGWYFSPEGGMRHPDREELIPVEEVETAVRKMGYDTPRSAFLAAGLDERGREIRQRRLP